MSRRMLIPIAAVTLILAFIIASGCTGSTAAPSAGGIKKFSSAAEIRQYIEENTKFAMEAEGGNYATDGIGMARDIAVAAPQAAVAGYEGLSVSMPSAGTTDYSTTNVQVAGIDEPDFVKNDARYIYLISGDTLTIVDAYPPATASAISVTPLDDTPRDLFIAGDRLVLFTTGTGAASSIVSTVYPPQVESMPSYRGYLPVTHAVFYDISDRAHPKVVKDYSMDGDYLDARLIGSNLYLVTREEIYTDAFTVPAITESGNTVASPDVYYFDNPERQYAFTTVTSFDTVSGNEKDAKTYLAGSGNIVYVSPDAMYITYQKYHSIRTPVRVFPVLAADDRQVSTARASSSGIAAPALPVDFNRMSEAEKQAVIAGMMTGEEGVTQTQEIDQTMTVIYKIAIDNGIITYTGRGEVPGYLRNQFAMDEYGGNLRVATTSDVWTTRGQHEYNNVFVLDAGMKTIGSLTHVAEQEKIYSTRFIGDRLYMVTFRRMDPFFVIDLSDPAGPKILGKLKIPGYSDYLHPYDKNLVIGLGKETGTNDWGGVSTQGIKLALFDVSDLEHPRQVGKVEIGDAGSDSAALSDHKAFLFDKAKNLLVIPARVVRQDTAEEKTTAVSQPYVWYGAYVFGVNPETGFVLRGTVEHGTGGSGYYYYGSSKNEVKRSLYIGDTLYTLSSAKILATPINRINTTVATIDIDTRADVLYPPLIQAME